MIAFLLPALVLAAHPALLAPTVAMQGGPPQDWTIPAGQTVTFSAGAGVLEFGNVTIEPGARLRFVGHCPVQVRVSGTLQIDGVLDVAGTGFNNGFGVLTFSTTNIQEPGLSGGPGGGPGGTGNRIHFASTAAGGDGGCESGGGQGGESAYGTVSPTQRHPGGGGGGAFGPVLPPVHPDPLHPSNNGRMALAGLTGSPSAVSALNGLVPAAGGAPGSSPFVDGNPDNDFWGRRIDPITLLLVTGELSEPRAGSGGGAGGNSIQANVFPNPNWSPSGDEKGAGGAGGGGLLIVRAQLVRVGPQGRILADGGRGGSGENTSGINCIGGGSGGGSGGMIVMHARRVDLAFAANNCLTALGGDGGRGANNQTAGAGAGGDGGPGLIQLHLANGLQDVILSGGRTLADMTVPEARVLLPEPGY